MPPACSRSATRLILLGVATLFFAACDTSKGSLLAPTDSVILLTSSTSLLPVNGTTSINVVVQQSNGTPVDDGTEVLLSATRGSLNEIKMRTRGGSVVVIYRAAAEAGPARIEASSAGARNALDLHITSGNPERVKVSAAPATLPPNGGATDVTATVTDGAGAPIAGAPVTFTATSGSLNPAGPVATDQAGIARTKLTTTASATVAARVHTTVAADVKITVREPVGLRLAADPTSMEAGDSTTFTITPSDTSVSGAMTMNFGDGTTSDLGQTKGKVTKEHVYKTAGGYNATAIFKPAGSPEVRETVRITVSAVTVNLRLEADPSTLEAGDSTTFTITPSDTSVTGAMSITFGDGTSAELGQTRGRVTKTHAYASAGGYNATAVFEPAGSPEVRSTVRITVNAASGINLSVDANPDTLEAGDSTKFTITPSDTSVTGAMSITFGDGASEELGQTQGKVTTAHVYKKAGGYNATAIFDPAGSPEVRATIRISVTAAPDPDPPEEPEEPEDPEPDPPSGIPADELDLRTVNFLHADVSDWDVTAELTDVDLSLPPLCLEYTGKNKWPNAGGTVGNPWVFAKIDGQWYGGTWEWFEQGQTCKRGIGPEGPGRLVKKSPLKEWHPQPGELVGFMVSTHARDKFRGPRQERTNVVLKRWPGN